MSTLDQPILIANSNYHVGHQVAIFVAEEQGFFREEGLKEYEYDSRGLIPGPIEREGLGAGGLKITALILRPPSMSRRRFTSVRSEVDVYIVGGWRYTPFLRWYGAKHVTNMSKLRGGRSACARKKDWSKYYYGRVA